MIYKFDHIQGVKFQVNILNNQNGYGLGTCKLFIILELSKRDTI
jgi:hypothetical protein